MGNGSTFLAKATALTLLGTQPLAGETISTDRTEFQKIEIRLAEVSNFQSDFQKNIENFNPKKSDAPKCLLENLQNLIPARTTVLDLGLTTRGANFNQYVFDENFDKLDLKLKKAETIISEVDKKSLDGNQLTALKECAELVSNYQTALKEFFKGKRFANFDRQATAIPEYALDPADSFSAFLKIDPSLNKSIFYESNIGKINEQDAVKLLKEYSELGRSDEMLKKLAYAAVPVDKAKLFLSFLTPHDAFALINNDEYQNGLANLLFKDIPATLCAEIVKLGFASDNKYHSINGASLNQKENKTPFEFIARVFSHQRGESNAIRTLKNFRELGFNLVELEDVYERTAGDPNAIQIAINKANSKLSPRMAGILMTQFDDLKGAEELVRFMCKAQKISEELAVKQLMSVEKADYKVFKVSEVETFKFLLNRSDGISEVAKLIKSGISAKQTEPYCKLFPNKHHNLLTELVTENIPLNYIKTLQKLIPDIYPSFVLDLFRKKIDLASIETAHNLVVSNKLKSAVFPDFLKAMKNQLSAFNSDDTIRANCITYLKAGIDPVFLPRLLEKPVPAKVASAMIKDHVSVSTEPEIYLKWKAFHKSDKNVQKNYDVDFLISAAKRLHQELGMDEKAIKDWIKNNPFGNLSSFIESKVNKNKPDISKYQGLSCQRSDNLYFLSAIGITAEFIKECGKQGYLKNEDVDQIYRRALHEGKTTEKARILMNKYEIFNPSRYPLSVLKDMIDGAPLDPNKKTMLLVENRDDYNEAFDHNHFLELSKKYNIRVYEISRDHEILNAAEDFFHTHLCSIDLLWIGGHGNQSSILMSRQSGANATLDTSDLAIFTGLKFILNPASQIMLDACSTNKAVKEGESENLVTFVKRITGIDQVFGHPYDTSIKTLTLNSEDRIEAVEYAPLSKRN